MSYKRSKFCFSSKLNCRSGKGRPNLILFLNESPDCPLHAQKVSATDSDRFYVFLIFEVEPINAIFAYFT